MFRVCCAFLVEKLLVMKRFYIRKFIYISLLLYVLYVHRYNSKFDTRGVTEIFLFLHYYSCFLYILTVHENSVLYENQIFINVITAVCSMLEIFKG